MILHAVTVKNWRNIGQLELRDLNHPLVLLHGPNRTGKSSLVAALRSCLLDHEHNSASGDLKANVPWRSKQVPEITVEFETGGRLYRLMKRYSKGKDGDACLERRRDGGTGLAKSGAASGVSSGEWDVLLRGKEAGRDVRKLLDLQTSDDGLNQLLWLNQGDISLPDDKKLNQNLQQRFEAVLGSLLTGHDWDFYARLKKECGRFFTETMGQKKNTREKELLQRLEEVQVTLQTLRGRQQQSERQRDDLERTLQDLVDTQKLVSESTAEIERLMSEQDASRERRRLHDLAVSCHTAAQKELADAEQRYEQIRDANTRLRKASADQESAEGAFEVSERERQAAQEAVQQAREAVQQARQVLDQQEEQRGELVDRKKLIDLEEKRTQACEQLSRADELAARLAELDEKLAQVRAPTKKELQLLRENRKEANTHRAELKANALQLTLRPLRNTNVGLAIDGGAETGIELSAENPWNQQFRQRVVVQLADFGAIEIQRGQTDRNLEETARQLAELDRVYADAVHGYGLSPELENALEQLEDRRSQQTQLTDERKRFAEEQHKLIPEGRGALEALRARCEAERLVVLQRRPGLSEWQPDAAEHEQLEREAERQLQRRKQACSEAERQLAAQEQQLAAVEERFQKAATRVTKTRTLQAAVAAETERLGDEQTLKQVCDAARGNVEQAVRQVAETALTADEQTLDQRLTEAQQALERREQRLVQQQRVAAELRGELRTMQGTHEELAAAEADEEQLLRELREEQLEAAAHKNLRELFESSRDEQVQRATGAFGARVMKWAQQLDLGEYRQLEFDKSYLPTALSRDGLDDPIALKSESFGTAEQLQMLIRLAAGGLLARTERQMAIFDDPLTHTDRYKHRKMLEILEAAAAGESPSADGRVVSGPLQILILTCHPERFDHLRQARHVDLKQLIVPGG